MRKSKRVENEMKEKKLTKKQLELLRLVYQFRFITSKQLGRFENQTQIKGSYARLELLVTMGYLAKHHDSSYRLQNRPAEYYISPKAIMILRSSLTKPSEREFKQFYARPQVSKRFIDRSLALLDCYLELRRLYSERLRFITKPQLNIDEFEYLPNPLPDGFIRLDSKTSRQRFFFVEYFDDAVSIGIHGRRISAYMNYKESGEWDVTGLDFPSVVIICESSNMRLRAERRIRYLEGQMYSDISFFVIDIASLKALENIRAHAWRDPIEKELRTL